jgi:beta-lactamase superfamily II metal-dependent hydrolase
VKGDDVVLVQYLPMSLTLQDPATLNSTEMKAYEATFYADGESIRVILTRSELLVNNAAANTGWTDAGITPKLHLLHLYDKHADGNNIGQCQIFTLADGSFIVVDGGSSPDAENVYKTLKEMNEREDGKIVVAAWILTHAHGDHTGALGTLAATEEWAKEITIEQMVLNHVAVSYRYRSTGKLSYRWENGFSAEFENIREVTSKFAQGENYKLIMPHMGQIMKIRNAEIEFLTVGDEDMFPVLFTNDNAQSLVFRVTYPTVTDQEIMIVGDSALDQTYNVFFPLMPDELHADILQVSHHGLGGQTSRFYPMFKNVKVAVWPTDWHTINKNSLMTSGTNAGL